MTDLTLSGDAGDAAPSSIVSESGDEIHARLIPRVDPEPDEHTQDAPADEAVDPEADASAPSESSAEEKPVPKGVQKRIDELTWRARELERRNAELEQRYAERNAPPAPNAVPQRDPSAAPNPDDFPGGRFDPDYLEARADWAGEQAVLRREQQRAEQSEQQTVRQRVQAFASAVPDYDDVMAVAAPMIDRLNPAVGRVFLESEAGPELAYVLGRAPQAMAELAALTPAKAIMALGKLEARIEAIRAEAAQPKPKEPPPEPERVTVPEPWKASGAANSREEALAKAEKRLESTGDATEWLRLRAKRK